MAVRVALIGSALLAVVLVVAYGGESKAERLETYFRGVEDAKARHDESVPPDLYGKAVGEVVELLRKENSVLAGLDNDLGDLSVPFDATSEHKEVVLRTRARIDIQEEIAQGLLDRGSSAFEEYIPKRERARRDWANAVCALQALARASDVTVDLGCDAEDMIALNFGLGQVKQLPYGEASCGVVSASRGRPAEELSTYIQFFNNRDDTVKLFRVGSDGDRELLATLQPDEQHLQFTYVDVGFLVTDENDQCLGGLFASGLGDDVLIQTPAFRP